MTALSWSVAAPAPLCLIESNVEPVNHLINGAQSEKPYEQESPWETEMQIKESGTEAWAVNVEMNGNYFTDKEGLVGIYADTNEVVASADEVVYGIQFYKKGNRLAPALYVYDLKEKKFSWRKNAHSGKDDYFPDKGGLKEFYADMNPILLSEKQSVVGFKFARVGNRVAPSLMIAEGNDRNKANWVTAGEAGKNDNYFGPLEKYYADTNGVVFSLGNKLHGFKLWQKNNRMAPALLA